MRSATRSLSRPAADNTTISVRKAGFNHTAENCSGYRTCSQCMEQPGCGWCTEPSNTGRGQCMEGSYRGPFQSEMPAPSSLPGMAPSLQVALNASMCPDQAKYNWSFVHCPGNGGGVAQSDHLSKARWHVIG
ncbi:hypothetical protein CRUP_034133 [Coryphaenoides rupestris]|nr:hypothetical protein CRUP_034133 [Coryphaenoides rupestris]